VSTFIDPDDVKTTPVVSKETKSEFVDPDTFVDPEESPTPTVAPVASAIPKAEDAPFLSNFGKILSLADTEAKKTAGKAVANAVDIVDLPLSAPAWIGGMAAGLVAANKHATDKLESVLIGTPEPAGLHFGAALAVSEDVLHKFGNPLRKALTGIGAVPTAADGINYGGLNFNSVKFDLVIGNKTVIKDATVEFGGEQAFWNDGTAGSSVIDLEGVGILIPPQVEYYVVAKTFQSESRAATSIRLGCYLFGTGALLNFNTTI